MEAEHKYKIIYIPSVFQSRVQRMRELKCFLKPFSAIKWNRNLHVTNTTHHPDEKFPRLVAAVKRTRLLSEAHKAKYHNNKGRSRYGKAYYNTEQSQPYESGQCNASMAPIHAFKDGPVSIQQDGCIY